jgi:tetratricopeptide (TPR) repeat protein
MFTILVFLYCAFASIQGIAQNKTFVKYYSLVDKAEYLLYKGHPRKALKYFEEAEHTGFNPPSGRYFYNQARCYAKVGKSALAKEYLIKSANKIQIRPSYAFPKDKYFKRKVYQKDTALYKELQLIDSLKWFKYNPSGQKTLADTIDEICDRDQIFRLGKNATKQPPKAAKEEYEIWLKDSNKNDSIIQEEIIRYTKIYGYPGILKSGSELIKIPLLHFSQENYARIRPYIISGLENGELIPEEVADIIDRKEYYENERIGLLYYGSNYTDNIEYWETAVKTRQEYGVTVYFIWYRKILEWPKLLPWVGKIVK